MILSADAIAAGLRARGVPESAIPTAVLIAARESSFKTDAQNPGGATGLFQFLPSAWRAYGCQGSALDANNSLDCFARAYKQSGFGDWGGSDVTHPTFGGKPITAYPGNAGATPSAIQKAICNMPALGGIIQGTPAGQAACSGIGSAVQGIEWDIAGSAGSAVKNAILPDWLKGITKDLLIRTSAVIFGAAIALVGLILVFNIPPPIPVPV